jgi:hypothetical protein
MPMTRSYEIKQEFLENYRYAHDFWAPFIEDARVYTLAQSGVTWSNEERKQLVKDGREPIEFNIMRRPIQFYSGYLRDNINSIVIAPVEGSDQQTADQLTKVSAYVWDKGQGFETFLDSADETLKSGISLCGVRLDYSKDFINGDISVYKRTYNSFYLDPTFENLDLRDCGFAIMRDLLNKKTVRSLLPNLTEEEIDDINTSFRDDKFLSYHPQFSSFSRNRNLLAYDQYYKRTTRKRLMLIDLKSNYYKDVTDSSDEKLSMIRKGLYRINKMSQEEDEDFDSSSVPKFELKQVDRPYIELSVMLNGQEVYVGEDKTKITETYPFVPNICYFEPSIWFPSQRLQGISSTQWSLQRQFNKRHMKILDMMDTDISTGFKYLIGTVPDPTELQQTGQNKIIGVSAEDNPFGLAAIEQLRGGGTNPALIEYQKILDELSLTLANINESVLGIDEKGNTQVSGRLAQVRIAQGLRSNRKVFDNIEQAQLLLGGLILQAIQKNYPKDKIKRILNEEPTQQFYNQDFEQFDAVIKEGVRTKSQKDAYYYELINLKRDGIVDVPQAEIVRALQMSGLSDLEKAIEQQEQGRAEQQKKIDEQEQMILKMQAAKIEESTALASERRARVLADIGLAEERHSEAASNQADAVLARAKAMVELSQLQEDRLFRVYDFLAQLAKEEEDKEDRVSEKSKFLAGSIDQSSQDLVAQVSEQPQQNSGEMPEQQGGIQ